MDFFLNIINRKDLKIPERGLVVELGRVKNCFIPVEAAFRESCTGRVALREGSRNKINFEQKTLLYC